MIMMNSYDDEYIDDQSRWDSAPASRQEGMVISWLHPIGMFGLSLYNFLLRILTLGIHHFWGKTEVRKRLWSSVRINGEPLEYTGTGRELFIGFLIVFVVVLLPVMLATFAAVFLLGPDTQLIRIFQVAVYVLFVFLTGIAIYRAQRYRLNRTRWRGIRAGLTGNSLKYGWTYFWTPLLVPITLGWIGPWRATLLQKMVTNDMQFGNRRFHFSGSSRPLYKSFTVFWLLTALLAGATLAAISAAAFDLAAVIESEGKVQLPPDRILEILAVVYGGIFLAGLVYMVLSAWYRAAMMRHFARYTHLDGLTFRSTVRAHGLLWISITNYLLLITGAIVITIAIAAVGMVLFSALAGAGIDPLGINTAASAGIVMQKVSGVMTFLFLLALGLFLPITQARSTGYLVRNMALDGTIDLGTVAAGADQDIKRGEGLAQAFDIDAL